MVKCKDCGFLATWNKHNHKLDEANRDYRNHGILTLQYDDKGRNQHEIHEQYPICFALAYDIRKEVENSEEIGSDRTKAVMVISKDRRCDKFTEWNQGFTPKEHREMVDRQKERKWRIIIGIIFVVLAGLFTLLGAYIANLN